MDDKARIVELRELLHKYNYLYYVNNSPIVSDQQFDMLMKELQELEFKYPELYDANSPTQRVGSDINVDFNQVKHKYPMLSLANTYNREEVRDFYKRINEGLGGEKFEICCELKFDGLSISLSYEKGKLVRALTRGDGDKGDDVTANVRTIQSIPLVLPSDKNFPEQFEVRGEILMPWKSFNRLNEEREKRGEQLFANPRNAASGTLKSKSSSVVAKRGLDAYFYYLLGEVLPSTSHIDCLSALKQWGFKCSDAVKKVDSLEDIYSFIDFWDKERHNLPFATDGIVLKVDSKEQQDSLGKTAKNPRWAIAYKFQADKAKTRLNNVIFQVGRTGAVTPVAEMEPIKLAGTIVKRASLHNADIMNKLQLHVGDLVYVEKAGEIIPQIVGVDYDSRDDKLGKRVEFISTCPECGAQLVRYEGEAASYCPNENSCPPQIKGKIEHFVSRDAMNIDGLGPEIIASYFDKGLIHNIADLYTLRQRYEEPGDLFNFNPERIFLNEIFSKKSGQNVLKAIDDSCNIDFSRVLYALGIRFVGKVVAKTLSQHFRTIENLQNATIEELQRVDGVGDEIAKSVRKYFSNPEHILLIDRLRHAGLQFEIKESVFSTKSNLLNGLSIVISGVFERHSREEYKNIIELNGGKNVSSISSKTSFILAGNNIGPSKLNKANDMGIKIMNEVEFLKLINEI